MGRKIKINELIIAGSGAYKFKSVVWGEEVDCREVKTPFGKSAPIHIYRKNGYLYGVISRHGEKIYNLSAGFVNYRANIYAAKSLGVSRILTWSGPGAINLRLKPGMLFLPDDLLDFTKKRDYTFFERNGLGFIRQYPVFCPDVRKIAIQVLKAIKIPLRNGGVYVCTEGPRLETPAEISVFKKLGGDAVGMTLVPEAFLARELEICYFPICYITNYAEGVVPLKYRDGELFEGTLPQRFELDVMRTMNLLPEILFSIIYKIRANERKCPCSRAMLRYRKEGRINNDWREWIK